MLKTPLHRLTDTGIDTVQFDDVWRIAFTNGDQLEIKCLWRLLEEGFITATSDDHGKDFGWKQIFDGVDALSALAKHQIMNVSMLPETGDIGIKFDNGTILQIIPVSAAAESWRFTQEDGVINIAKSGQVTAL